MSARAQALGRYGEDVAARFLTDLGYVVVDRNWRSAHGELDIVAMDQDTLVICEVKTRVNDRFGGPIAAITEEKLQRLRRLCVEWLSTHECNVAGLRVDVVAIHRPRRGPAQIQHVVGVY